MTPPRTIGTAQCYGDVVDVMRDRKAELGLTDAVLDAVSGVQSGYTGKLLGPAQIKTMGMATFFYLVEALGMRLVFQEDMDIMQKMATRWEQRARPVSMLNMLSTKAINRARPYLEQQIVSDVRRRAGLASAESRKVKIPQKKRQRIAKHAAKVRWKRYREAKLAERAQEITKGIENAS